MLDESRLSFGDAKPLIRDERTLVPVRTFFESMGAVLQWDPIKRTVATTLKKGTESAGITLAIDSPYLIKEYADVGGKTEASVTKLDVQAQIIDGHTYIPLRAAAEAFGYLLDWNPITNTAALKFSGSTKNRTDATYPVYDTTESAAALSDYEREVFVLTNEQRIAEGLKPLVLNVALSAVARQKSQDMVDNQYFDHQSAKWGSPFDMMKDAGIRFSAAAENIAKGQLTPEQVVRSWMNSAGHRANILNAKYTELGVGFVQGEAYNNKLWTQQFINP
ncbi:hypothetical protein D3C73_999320 [compost metagenome]